MKFSFFIFIWTFASGVFAASSSIEVCSGIAKISRPFFPDEEKSPTFEYSFKYIDRGAATTIIYLPGGPGATSIFFGMSEEGLNVLLPDSANVILTDPRGVGCNLISSISEPSRFFSTRNLASDVTAIIRSLGLKDYVIWGHSYGTVLGTQIAASISREKLPLPRAVVLAGTVGHHLDFPYAGYQYFWSKAKESLSPKTLEALSGANLPFGLSARYWGAYIFHKLAEGSVDQDQSLGKRLSILDSNEQESLNALKTEVIEAGTHQSSSTFLRLYKPIWCRELAKTDNTDLSLVNGELVGKQEPDFCKGYELQNPFDSKDWQISSPIYYFHGQEDPILRYFEDGMYHMRNQISTDRHFILVPKAGHDPIAVLSDCREFIWEAILNAGVGLQSALTRCALKPTLKVIWPTSSSL